MIRADDAAAPQRFSSVSTERLTLRVPELADVDDLFALYADPAVWQDDPASRQVEPSQTVRMIERWRRAWQLDRLGIWVATSAEQRSAGELVGIGGCFLRHGVAWNLGYRLRPAFWGRGLAQELIAAATTAARTLRPDLPLTASLLEGNRRSQRTAERAGLRLVWRGPDTGNPDPDAVRLLFADREPSADVIEKITAE